MQSTFHRNRRREEIAAQARESDRIVGLWSVPSYQPPDNSTSSSFITSTSSFHHHRRHVVAKGPTSIRFEWTGSLEVRIPNLN
jgi:hypothetical protein